MKDFFVMLLLMAGAVIQELIDKIRGLFSRER